jgi:nucleotide-binding universal stress UspA family protein
VQPEPEVVSACDHLDRTDDRLRERIAELKGEPVDPATVECLRFGEPAEEVVAFAAESHASLIIAGTHGRTGLGRMLIGSVAERVWLSAPCPVLVLQGQSESQAAARRVLVAVDGSPSSTTALALALKLAADDAEIDAVNVVAPGRPIEPAREGLQAAIERALAPQPGRVRAVVESGDAAEVLARRAAEGGYDLVACGTRGHVGLERFLERSVARALSRVAPRFLVVREGRSKG